ncbi:hypothetical protein Tco_1412293 [Tanacetum coccineum]
MDEVSRMITSGDGGSTAAGGDGEGDLSLLQNDDGKSNGDGEDGDGKSDSGGEDDDGNSNGSSGYQVDNGEALHRSMAAM